MYTHIVFFIIVCSTAYLTPSTADDVRRSDDAAPLADVVAQQTQLIEQQRAELAAMKADLSNVKAELQALKSQTALANEPTAFLTCLAQSVDLAVGAHLKFPSASINLGNGYHAGSSTFVAPVSGLYALSFKVIGANAMRFVMRKEGQIIAETETADSDGADRAFVQTLVQMTAGQSVWVEKYSGAGTSIWGGGANTCFFGFLLHRDSLSS